MDPLWSETCWSNFKYFIILIVSTVHWLDNEVFDYHWCTVQTCRLLNLISYFKRLMGKLATAQCFQYCQNNHPFFFNVLLTLHLSIFISVINQLDAQNLCFTIWLFHAFHAFRASCANHQEVRTVLYSIWYRHTCRCDDNRCCSKHVEAWNKPIVKQKLCASSWLSTKINYT